MGKKILIFVCGVVTGVILTFVAAYLISNSNKAGVNIKYYDASISYEDKSNTKFKVLQVLENCALANEEKYPGDNGFFGKTVLLKSDKLSFYSDQVVEVDNPKQVGTYSYTSNLGMDLTVPVIDID